MHETHAGQAGSGVRPGWRCWKVEKKENDKALATWSEALVARQAVLDNWHAEFDKHETSGQRLAKELAEDAQKQKRERHAADSFEEEQERMTELLEASTREARLSLRAHASSDYRADRHLHGRPVWKVPENLKTAVYPDRYGLMCYSVKLIWRLQDLDLVGRELGRGK